MPIFVNVENKIFMGAGVPGFREGQVENRAETGKCSVSQGFEERFSHLSLNGRNVLILLF